MSTLQPTTDGCIASDNHDDFSLPENTDDLFYWLDEQPNFIDREVAVTVRTGTDSYKRRDKETTKTIWLHPDYEHDTRACYDSQGGVANAWSDMLFPVHNWDTLDGLTGPHIYSWSTTSGARRSMRRFNRGTVDTESTINYEAVQHPNGHGVIMHYSTIAAIRTKAGLVLNNEQDYATGFAKVTRPDDADYTLPLDGIRAVLDDKPESIYDIESVARDMTNIRYETTFDTIGGHRTVTGVREAFNDRQVQLVDLTSGAAVVLLWDSTANNRDERKCGFYLPPEERQLAFSAQDALDALRPTDVKQAMERGLDIIPADDYAASGATYDGSQLGDAIIRQGEWYLVPQPEDWEPSNPIKKCLPRARDSDWDFSPLPEDERPDKFDLTDYDSVTGILPARCPSCAAGNLEVHSQHPFVHCDACDTTTAYDEEEAEEFADKALLTWLTDEYDDLYSFVQSDVLDSHVPRDLVVDPDTESAFIRGTFRHQANEHQMLNLDERWHLAAENTRDVVVFDLGTGETAGRTSGVARYE